MEILKWNKGILTPNQVQIVAGTKDKKLKISLDPNAKVWLFTAEGYAAHIHQMQKTFDNIKEIFCDEPHLYYRGWKSKRTQSFVNSLTPDMGVKFLTATPTPRGKLSAAYIYCHVIQRDYYHNYDFFLRQHAILNDWGQPEIWLNHEVLWKFLDNYSICHSYEAVHGKTEKFMIRDVVELEGEQQKFYRRFETEGIADIENIIMTGSNGGVASLRTRQILNHPHSIKLPVSWDNLGEPDGWDTVSVIPLEKVTPKMERILEYAEEGEPLTIFATFDSEIRYIEFHLKKAGYRVGVINGTVPQVKRALIDEAYQAGELDIVVASAATAGVGFNWGHVNTCIFHSLNYGDDELVQAIARQTRGIRTKPLRIVLLEYANTIDQYVMWAIHHNSKSSHASNANNPIIYFPRPTVVEDEEFWGGRMDFCET